MTTNIGFRKEHKTCCKGVVTGKQAVGRDLVMKVTERFMASEEIGSWVMGLLVSILDLANHPENATEYGVILFAGTRPMVTNASATVSQPQKKTSMLFQLLQVKQFANSEVEMCFPALKTLSEDLSQRLDKQLSGAEWQNTVIVHAAWVSEENPSAIQMFCEHINRAQCKYVQSLRLTTEELIRSSPTLLFEPSCSEDP